MSKIVILCGGQGTRLREETEYKPKPMVKVGEKPILWHIMKLFSHYGYYDFVLCLGYKGQAIKEYFMNYDLMNNDFKVHVGSKQKHTYLCESDELNWIVTLADTGMNAMTGARLKKVEKYIDSDYFLLTYGDAVADVNIHDLVDFHKKSGRIATLTGIMPSSKYGMLEIEHDKIIKFNEKPKSNGYVNGGFFVFDRRIFDYLSSDDGCILERYPLEKLAFEGQLGIYQHQGFWECMDTFRDMEMLNNMFNEGDTPWMVWQKEYIL